MNGATSSINLLQFSDLSHPKTEAEALFDQAGTDPTERQRILEVIERTNIEAKRYNRSFSVVLAHGISRRVVLNHDDPTDFVAEVTVDAAGNPAGSEGGTDLQTLVGSNP